MDILGSQVHPMVQVLFPNNNAIFQDGDLPINTARSVQSCFEEHEDALQHHLWLAQSPGLNIIKPLVSVREQGEKQIPSIISIQANGGPTPFLIKKCVYFTAVSIIFVHPLYMLPS